jgi:CheY-like chemotaxis protein
MSAKAPPHVLLVEDEPGTLTTVALLLEMSGFRVTQASNGERALQQLARERPDIVLTDFMMPHVNGLELIQAMRGQPALAAIPVILTSAALPADIEPSKVAQGFITKPYRIEAVIQLIESILAA